MAVWTCERCGKEFKRNRCGTRVVRFCSQDCYHEWNRELGNNAGRFPKGKPPWNKGTKGLMKPNAGTFTTGHQLGTLAVGTITIRIDKMGHQRSWVKITDKRKLNDWKMRAVIVWEEKHGQLSAGQVVHHKDRDTLNDDITNLDAMSRAEHLAEHRPQYEERRRYAASKATKARHAKNRAARK